MDVFSKISSSPNYGSERVCPVLAIFRTFKDLSLTILVGIF